MSNINMREAVERFIKETGERARRTRNVNRATGNHDFVTPLVLEAINKIETGYSGFFLNTPFGKLAMEVQNSNWTPMNIVSSLKWESAGTTKFTIINMNNHPDIVVRVGYSKKFTHRILMNILSYAIIDGTIKLLTNAKSNEYDTRIIFAAYKKSFNPVYIDDPESVMDEVYDIWRKRSLRSRTSLVNETKRISRKYLEHILRGSALIMADQVTIFRSDTKPVGLVTSGNGFYDAIMIVSAVANNMTGSIVEYIQSMEINAMEMNIDDIIEMINKIR